MFTGRRNGQASSCCSNCSRSSLHGASSRCCFFVSVLLLPSFRGEAVGVAGSDELTSSTCVFDAVDGVGLRRKTTREIICTISFRSAGGFRFHISLCGRMRKDECIRFNRVRDPAETGTLLSMEYLRFLSGSLCSRALAFITFSAFFRPLSLSRYFFRLRHLRPEDGTYRYDEFFFLRKYPSHSSTSQVMYNTLGNNDVTRMLQGVPTMKRVPAKTSFTESFAIVSAVTTTPKPERTSKIGSGFPQNTLRIYVMQNFLETTKIFGDFATRAGDS